MGSKIKSGRKRKSRSCFVVLSVLQRLDWNAAGDFWIIPQSAPFLEQSVDFVDGVVKDEPGRREQEQPGVNACCGPGGHLEGVLYIIAFGFGIFDLDH